MKSVLFPLLFTAFVISIQAQDATDTSAGTTSTDSTNVSGGEASTSIPAEGVSTNVPAEGDSTDVSAAGDQTNDGGSDAVTQKTCGDEYYTLGGECIEKNIVIVPSIAVGVFLFICLITLIAVLIYHQAHPYPDEEKTRVHSNPKYSPALSGIRGDELWAGVDETEVEPQPRSKAPENVYVSNGKLPRYGYDNQSFEGPDYLSVIDDDLTRRGPNAPGSHGCRSIPSRLSDNAYDEPTPRPPAPDRYMDELEMSDAYTKFSPNMAAITRDGNYSILRPKLVRDTGSSIHSGQFSGGEINI